MRARAYIVQKEAESEADCQDRFSINPGTGSVAVSDGMSQSLFPKYWAELLARRYTSDSGWVPSRENVKALSPLWLERVEERLGEMRSEGRDTWRAEGMLAEGGSAGATLVGLRTSPDGSWRCDVLGDSCLVELEGNRIKGIFCSADQFDNYPDYYDSNPGREGKGELRTVTGRWNVPPSPTTTLLLVSDALGAFLSSLRGTPEEAARVRELLSVESADELSILAGYWRKEGMHNDDVTLVVVTEECHPGDAFNRQEEWVW